MMSSKKSYGVMEVLEWNAEMSERAPTFHKSAFRSEDSHFPFCEFIIQLLLGFLCSYASCCISDGVGVF
jgi:hypothetical protein